MTEGSLIFWKVAGFFLSLPSPPENNCGSNFSATQYCWITWFCSVTTEYAPPVAVITTVVIIIIISIIIIIIRPEKNFSEGYCFHLRLWFFFFGCLLVCWYVCLFVCWFVDTITLERLNQSKPNFHTWLLTGIARPSSKMGIAGHM